MVHLAGHRYEKEELKPELSSPCRITWEGLVVKVKHEECLEGLVTGLEVSLAKRNQWNGIWGS